MKKLVLGLLLAVGVSSVSYANGIEINTSFDENEYFESIELADCQIWTNVKTYDANGNLVDNKLYITYGTGSECDNAVGGVVVNMKSVHLSGDIQP